MPNSYTVRREEKAFPLKEEWIDGGTEAKGSTRGESRGGNPGRPAVVEPFGLPWAGGHASVEPFGLPWAGGQACPASTDFQYQLSSHYAWPQKGEVEFTVNALGGQCQRAAAVHGPDRRDIRRAAKQVTWASALSAARCLAPSHPSRPPGPGAGRRNPSCRESSARPGRTHPSCLSCRSPAPINWPGPDEPDDPDTPEPEIRSGRNHFGVGPPLWGRSGSDGVRDSAKEFQIVPSADKVPPDIVSSSQSAQGIAADVQQGDGPGDGPKHQQLHRHEFDHWHAQPAGDAPVGRLRSRPSQSPSRQRLRSPRTCNTPWGSHLPPSPSGQPASVNSGRPTPLTDLQGNQLTSWGISPGQKAI